MQNVLNSNPMLFQALLKVGICFTPRLTIEFGNNNEKGSKNFVVTLPSVYPPQTSSVS